MTGQKSYIRGRRAKAACSLMDHLRGRGVSAQVGYLTKKSDGTLYVEINEGNADLVPSEWAGFATEIIKVDWKEGKAVRAKGEKS